MKKTDNWKHPITLEEMKRCVAQYHRHKAIWDVKKGKPKSWKYYKARLEYFFITMRTRCWQLMYWLKHGRHYDPTNPKDIAIAERNYKKYRKTR